MGGHFKLLSYPPKRFLGYPSKCPTQFPAFSLCLGDNKPHTSSNSSEHSHISATKTCCLSVSSTRSKSSTTHQGKSASAAYRQSASRPDLQVPSSFSWETTSGTIQMCWVCYRKKHYFTLLGLYYEPFNNYSIFWYCDTMLLSANSSWFFLFCFFMYPWLA